MSALGKRWRQKKIYYTIFLFGFFVIALSISAISILLIASFSGIVRGELIHSAKLTNRYVSNQTVTASQSALNLTSKIYNDNMVRLLTSPSGPSIFDVSAAFSQLRNYRLTENSIHSIYVYNGHTDTLYIEADTSSLSSVNTNFQTSHGNFPDKSFLPILQNYKKYIPVQPIPRALAEGDSSGGICYSMIMYNIYSQADRNSLILVNFSYDWIFGTERGTAGDAADNVFAVDAQGNLISKHAGFSQLENLSHLSYIRQALASNSSSGALEHTIGGKKCLILYNRENPYGWTFFSITPWSALLAKITQMKLLTLLMGLVVFSLLLFVAYLISNRIYTPIGEIITELKHNKDSLRSGKVILRQIFLRDLLLGKTIASVPYLTGAFQKHDIPLSPGGKSGLLLLKIEQYHLFDLENTASEQSSLKYAILNVAQEIFTPEYPVAGTEMENDILALIIGVAPPLEASFSAAVRKCVPEIQSQIETLFHIQLSAAVSSVPAACTDISAAYRETRNTLRHRFFFQPGCLLFSGETSEKSITDYCYSFCAEKKLLDALAGGSLDDACAVYAEMTGPLPAFPLSCMEMTVSRLIYTLNTFLKSKKLDYKFELPESPDSMESVSGYFRSGFQTVCHLLETDRSAKYDQLICAIEQLIHSEYANPCLSIEFIADKLGLSVSHICRVYKQFTNHTILDFILRVRIGKARELLEKTRISAGDVARETGFSSSSYFNKVFKRITGFTPHQYRQSFEIG